MIKLKTLTILLLTVAFHANSQTCTEVLRDATQVYNDGKPQFIPKMLEECLVSGFTKEEEVEALKLLTLSYIYMDEPYKADEAFLKLLKIDPLYEVNESIDPIEFMNLYNSFNTDPAFMVGAKVGTNFTQVNSTRYYGVHNLSSSKGSYVPKAGFQIGVTFELPLYKQLIFNPELFFSSKSFSHNSPDLYKSTVGQLATETQTWIEAPLLVQYEYKLNTRLKVAALVGPSLSYMLSSNFVGEVNALDAGQDFTGAGIDIYPYRNPLSINGVFGTCVKYKIGGSFLIFDVRYNLGFSQLSKENQKFTDQNLIFNYGYVDNNFKVDYWTFSFGFLLPKYNHKKIN